jgi:hypothetical protein
MGLGRHRAAKHGVVSQRQSRLGSRGEWVTRQEAARKAGVHYNTIRHWEQSGLLRIQRGASGSTVSSTDLDRVVSGRGLGGGDAAVATLERRFAELIDGLERLIAGVKATTAPRRRGRPPGSKTLRKPVSTPKARGKRGARKRR